MVITQTTKTNIYCYHDYTFLIFGINSLIVGADEIGVAWAAGKANTPMKAPLNIIKKDSCYHNILTSYLIEKIK